MGSNALQQIGVGFRSLAAHTARATVESAVIRATASLVRSARYLDSGTGTLGHSAVRSFSTSSYRLSSRNASNNNTRLAHIVAKTRCIPSSTPAFATTFPVAKPLIASRSYTNSSDGRVFIHNINGDTSDELIEVCINNTKKLNSLDSRLIEDLTKVISDLSNAPKTRCIVLRGAQDRSSSKTPSFCAGASLDEMSALNNTREAQAFIQLISNLCKAITDCPIPVIAAIDGHCYGAGLEIAASCDVRYATARSKFAMPEVLVGIPSVVQARLLVDIMGWAHAKHLMLFGKTLSGDEACRQGLLNEVFADMTGMQARIQEDTDALLKCGPRAVRVQKSLIREWQSMDVDTGIQAGVVAFAMMWDDGGQEPKAYMAKALQRLKSKKGGK